MTSAGHGTDEDYGYYGSDDGGYAAQRAAVAELTVKDQAAEIAMLQSIIDVLDEHNVASAVRAALRGDTP